ncbi:hypothetical protein DFJ74DRAFT_766592 [Hyaloraphidium curvatum]|nr:hypothetical protein DFJ74DRAFT_766592 [Hyaloraphidium curvatum]
MAPPPAPNGVPSFLSVPGCAPDYTLVVGTGADAAEFRAHRVFLARFSPFFAAAAGGSFKEGRSGRWELPDEDASVVLLLLRFIYRDPGFRIEELAPEELGGLLELGDKLGVDELPEEADRVLLGPLFALAAAAGMDRTVAAARAKLLAAPQDLFEEVLDRVAGSKPSLACELAVQRMKEMRSVLSDYARSTEPPPYGVWKEKLDKFIEKPKMMRF